MSRFEITKNLRKGQLQNLLNDFSVHEVRSETINVIQEFRGCSKKEAGDKKIVKVREIEEIIKRIA